MSWLALLLALVALMIFWLPPFAVPLAMIAALIAVLAIRRGRLRRLEGGSDAVATMAATIALLALIPSLIIAGIIAAVTHLSEHHFEGIRGSDPRSEAAGDYTTM
ncbi:MAG: hypothetical protein EA402_02870 [Planctomycetota bacterium]|nr:MAG: hypothetical protein EA402_02870 [Planctomycetota bacterium]